MEELHRVYRTRFKISHLSWDFETTLCGLTANGHGLFLGSAPEETVRAFKLRLCKKCDKLAHAAEPDLESI